MRLKRPPIIFTSSSCGQVRFWVHKNTRTSTCFRVGLLPFYCIMYTRGEMCTILARHRDRYLVVLTSTISSVFMRYSAFPIGGKIAAAASLIMTLSQGGFRMQAVGGRIIMIGHVYLQHWVIKKNFPNLIRMCSGYCIFALTFPFRRLLDTFLWVFEAGRIRGISYQQLIFSSRREASGVISSF